MAALSQKKRRKTALFFKKIFCKKQNQFIRTILLCETICVGIWLRSIGRKMYRIWWLDIFCHTHCFCGGLKLLNFLLLHYSSNGCLKGLLFILNDAFGNIVKVVSKTSLRVCYWYSCIPKEQWRCITSILVIF